MTSSIAQTTKTNQTGTDSKLQKDIDKNLQPVDKMASENNGQLTLGTSPATNNDKKEAIIAQETEIKLKASKKFQLNICESSLFRPWHRLLARSACEPFRIRVTSRGVHGPVIRSHDATSKREIR
ncbi:hypothetical protein CEXT_428741 [Caerostris extrusa]|uniref:Uncharacterized protein n=1 Tax=Caerostris extrusa TaxID=172846 RepID=A0AAV4N0P3_CAEEX|nr:hypothetical protein CEXT_428741 [Caerostris extrusa]